MRIAVLSDVHANVPALEAVLEDAGQVDAVWQLGDVVGYGPDPDGVVAHLRRVGAVGVKGNHDAAAVGGSEIEWFNPDARRAMEWTRGAISDDTAAWLRDLPERRSEGDAELVHGSHREPLWEYVLSDNVAAANLGALVDAGLRIGLHGHTHLPVAYVEDRGRLLTVRACPDAPLELDGRAALVNPGSVGQPRDGDPDASYLIFEPEAQRVTWRRVPYDVASVQRAMREAGLPPSLVSRLAVGL